MSICDRCIHDEVCGLEDNHEEGIVSCADMIPKDVLDKIREEIVDTLYVDSLIFGELIDFKNGKISADDVIEEFNRITRLEVLKIIDKYRNKDLIKSAY